VEADQEGHAKVNADSAAQETREWRDWLHHALDEVRVEHVGLLVDNYDGLFDNAYGADKKSLPSARDVRVGDVDERFLKNMEKGVLYRVRR
jgi:hypothetical protein